MKSPLLCCLHSFVLLAAMIGRAVGVHDWHFLVAELVLLITMFCVTRFVIPMLERGDRGASGEEHVGGILDGMSGADWRVIHDASLGRGNIDHIVIGPPGVFVPPPPGSRPQASRCRSCWAC